MKNYLKRVDYCSNRGYYNNYWFYKLIIGLGKGKHTYDKSKAIKLRDLDRDLQKTSKIVLRIQN
jgi:tmRNA-binding protein